MNPSAEIDAKRMSTWGTAVHATYYAIEARTRAAWQVAAQRWDALAALHSPVENDREIYRRLAVRAWTQAATVRQ